MSKTLIYVAGPTAVGKTALSISLAKAFDTEIISCDSRQFYKEMTVGTTVPTAGELAEVPHHFIQHKSVTENYTIGDFEKDTIHFLKRFFKTKDHIIMVGGSGLYADAVMFGVDKFPDVPAEVKNWLNVGYQLSGIKFLQQLLLEKDPNYYRKVDRNNPQRLIRALGVCLSSGIPYSDFLGRKKDSRFFTSKILVLQCPRYVLYERINSRVDAMIASGLEEEAKCLYPNKHLNPLKTVGYNELFELFDGKYTRREAISEIKKNSRRYAKRQITWFRKYRDAFLVPFNTRANQICNLINFENEWPPKREL